MRNSILCILLLLTINTINAQCTSNTLLTDATYGIQNVESPDYIKATNKIADTGNVIYHAGNSIVLAPSFVAIAGCKAHLYIKGCTGTFIAKQEIVSSDIEVKDGYTKIVQVSPNPSNGIFKIVLNNHFDGVIEIADFVGLTIYKSRFINQNEIEVNLQDKPKGIYIVKVVLGEQIVITKIIKE